MPGKVNPVIPEAVSQAAMLVMGHDATIAIACASGSLELNPFLPLVADCLLESLDLLARADDILRRHCVDGHRSRRGALPRHRCENSTAAADGAAAGARLRRAGEVAPGPRERADHPRNGGRDGSSHRRAVRRTAHPRGGLPSGHPGIAARRGRLRGFP